ncbi:MAG: hypothetical protein UZ14_CFX002002786 [Chloroflexi bacterium OLB14]|nr:MAG: hypothetical protein UZ14_CFX002002786 [Chloroflexi bacterium OLB14]
MNKKYILILGDIIAFIILTYVGFAFHGGLDLLRFFALLLPLLAAWFLLIPRFDLLNQEVIKQAKNLYLVAFAMLFVIPLGIAVRGYILNMPTLPIFVLAMYAANALGMLIWRFIYIFIAKKN